MDVNWKMKEKENREGKRRKKVEMCLSWKKMQMHQR